MYKIYTTKYVSIVSLILTIIVFLIINSIYFCAKNPSIFQLGFQDTVKVEFNDNSTLNSTNDVNNTNSLNDKNTNDLNNNTLNEKKDNTIQSSWYLKIPRIFLEAEISEGTSTDVMNKYIGHFEDTSKTTGNVCLAAHNRGYPVNYFQNLKLLKKGDKIQYKYQNFEKQYVVVDNFIIRDTDWSCMEKTEDNMITLITCVENEPEYRRCVRASLD